MAREETKYIVIHCSQTRPSQNIGAKEIDRWHRERGWLKIGYGKVIKRDGTVEQGRGDDEIQAHVKGYNHCGSLRWNILCCLAEINAPNPRENPERTPLDQYFS